MQHLTTFNKLILQSVPIDGTFDYDFISKNSLRFVLSDFFIISGIKLVSVAYSFVSCHLLLLCVLQYLVTYIFSPVYCRLHLVVTCGQSCFSFTYHLSCQPPIVCLLAFYPLIACHLPALLTCCLSCSATHFFSSHLSPIVGPLPACCHLPSPVLSTAVLSAPRYLIAFPFPPCLPLSLPCIPSVGYTCLSPITSPVTWRPCLPSNDHPFAATSHTLVPFVPHTYAFVIF